MDATVTMDIFTLLACIMLHPVLGMITIGPGMYPSNKTLQGGPNSILVLGSCEFMHNGTLSNFNFYVATMDWMALQIWRPVYKESPQMSLVYQRLVQPSRPHRVIQLWIEDENINVTTGDRLGLVKLNATFPVPIVFNPQISSDLLFRRLESDTDLPRVNHEYTFEELTFPYHFSITVTFKPDISDFYTEYITKISQSNIRTENTDDGADWNTSINISHSIHNSKHDVKDNTTKDHPKETLSVDLQSNSVNRDNGNSIASQKVGNNYKEAPVEFTRNVRITDSRASVNLPKRQISRDAFKFLMSHNGTSGRNIDNASSYRSSEISRYFTLSDAPGQSSSSIEEDSFTSLDNITEVQGASNIGLLKNKYEISTVSSINATVSSTLQNEFEHNYASITNNNVVLENTALLQNNSSSMKYNETHQQDKLSLSQNNGSLIESTNVNSSVPFNITPPSQSSGSSNTDIKEDDTIAAEQLNELTTEASEKRPRVRYSQFQPHSDNVRLAKYKSSQKEEPSSNTENNSNLRGKNTKNNS